MSGNKPNFWIGIAVVVVGLVQYGLIISYPRSPWTYLPLVAGAVYAGWTYFHPLNRYHRIFVSLVAASVGTAALPSIFTLFDADAGRFELVIQQSQSVLSPILAWLAVVAFCFDYRQRNPEERSWVFYLPVVLGAALATAVAVFPVSDTSTARRSGADKHGDGQAIVGDKVHIQGDSSQAGRDVNIQQGLSEAFVERLIDGAVAEKDKIIADQKRQIEELKAGFGRVASDAAQGDSAAARALQNARESGDSAAIQAHLLAEAQAKRSSAEMATDEYVAICKEIAAIALARFDLPTAERQLNEIIRLRPTESEAWTDMGNIHSYRGNDKDAEAAYRKVLEIAAERSPSRAVALSNLGVLYIRKGQLDEAKRLIEQAIDLARMIPNDSIVAGATAALGEAMLQQGNLNDAEKRFKEALDLHHKTLGSADMAQDYARLGHVALARGDSQLAMQMFGKAASTRKWFGETSIAQSLEHGLVLLREGKAADAKPVFLSALRRFEDLKMPYETEAVLQVLAQAAIATEEYESEQEYRTKARQVAKEVDSPRIHVAYLTAIAGSLLKKEEVERADKAIIEAIELVRQHNLKGSVEVAHAIGTKGLIHRRRSEFVLAAKCHNEAFTDFERLGYMQLAGTEMLNLGMVELQQDKLDEAGRCFAEALEMFQRTGATETIALAYKNLAAVAAGENDELRFRQMRLKAIELYRQIGNEQKAKSLEADLTILEAANRWGAPEHKIKVGKGDIITGLTPSLCFSSDGRWLAGGSIGMAYLWDTRSGKQLYEFTHKGAIVGLAFAPDGQLLVTASAEGTIRLWDLATGKQQSEFASGGSGSHVGPIDVSLVDRLLIYGDPVEAKLGVYDFLTKERRTGATAHKGPVVKLDTDEKGKRVVTGGMDGSIRVWNYEQGSAESLLGMHDARIRAIKVVPNQPIAISLSEDGIVRTWDLEKVSEISTAMLNPLAASPVHSVTAAAYSDDGETLVVGYAGGDVSIGSLPKKHESLRKSVHRGIVVTVAVSRDGKLVASAGAADATVCIWRAKEGSK